METIKTLINSRIADLLDRQQNQITNARIAELQFILTQLEPTTTTTTINSPTNQSTTIVTPALNPPDTQ